jgi:energy-coupling factor transport system permease protein
MSEFEVLRFLAIGQYLPTDSALHRLDPRVKLTGIVLLALALLLRSGPALGLLGLGLALTLLALAQVPLGHALRGLKPLLPLFLIALVLQMLLYPHREAIAAGSLALLDWGLVIISGASIVALGTMLLTMADIVLLLTLLTATADVSDVTHGIEGLLRPFQRLGFPAHELSMVLVVALRFVPLLGRELERLMKAQAARGADFGRGRGGLVQRIRRTLPLLVPLFVAALRRSEELVVAMESRGYTGGRGRTSLVRLQLRPADAVALILSIGVCVLPFVVDFGPTEHAVALWLRGLLAGT